ncbi:hypothetical protein V6N11_040217 [Hibiscus sabdariffa]|uniref:Uncharacterized protein n=1 Tax=Hibiscus sabdariffa TaxID=183260 RepID=A0ABR2RGU5_9ROSI
MFKSWKKQPHEWKVSVKQQKEEASERKGEKFSTRSQHDPCSIHLEKRAKDNDESDQNCVHCRLQVKILNCDVIVPKLPESLSSTGDR